MIQEKQGESCHVFCDLALDHMLTFLQYHFGYTGQVYKMQESTTLGDES